MSRKKSYERMMNVNEHGHQNRLQNMADQKTLTNKKSQEVIITQNRSSKLQPVNMPNVKRQLIAYESTPQNPSQSRKLQN